MKVQYQCTIMKMGMGNAMNVYTKFLVSMNGLIQKIYQLAIIKV